MFVVNNKLLNPFFCKRLLFFFKMLFNSFNIFSLFTIFSFPYLIILFSGLLSCEIFFYLPITSNTELLTLSMSSLLILNSKDEKVNTIDEPKIPGNISPWFLTGFTEGDACFCVSIRSSGGITAIYSIGLNEREHPLLIKIQSFFGTGNINKTPNNRAVYFTITAIAYLNSIIVKHFDSYPLVGAKQSNYLIWREIVSIMSVKVHRTPEGKIKIKSLTEKLNK
jgi:hypothetical protein